MSNATFVFLWLVLKDYLGNFASDLIKHVSAYYFISMSINAG